MVEQTSSTPRVVEKPWGRETIFAETDHYVGKILFIVQGQRLSMHYHERKGETMYVLRGHVRMTIGPASEGNALHEVDLASGETIDLPPGTVHRLAALEDTEIVEVSTPELDDLIRLRDDYGRAGSATP